METLLRNPYFIVVVIAFVMIEAVWRVGGRRGYDWGSMAASFGVALGNFAFKPLNALIVGAAYFGLTSLAPTTLPIDDWRVWVSCFIAVEFCYYWFHRWSHLVRWMWCSHAVHHSAQEMTFPAAIRLGWTGALSGGWLVFAPLILVGFPPLMVMALLSANLAYQFFLHTEAVRTLGPLEWVLNTPAHHRVHHACNDPYLDKNFGGVVIIFDRLFGTFAKESEGVPPIYGLTTGFASRNPIWIALHEWAAMASDLRRARSIDEAGAALFGRPGALAARGCEPRLLPAKSG